MESLTTIAEIGVALAGFSGLVVVLRKKTGPLNEIERYRMSVLLAAAFGAMFLALLPGAMRHLGMADELIWRASSALLTAFTAVFILSWVLSSRRIFTVAREIFNVWAFSLMAVGHLINAGLQLSVALDFWGDGSSGVFLLGLIWLLAHASQQFVRMLLIQPRSLDSGIDT